MPDDKPVSDSHEMASSGKQMMMYDANPNSVGVSYLLWFFLGGLGSHRFYLGKTGTAIGQLALLVISSLLTVVGIGLFGFAVLGVWILVDAFLIPGIVREHNTKLANMLG